MARTRKKSRGRLTLVLSLLAVVGLVLLFRAAFGAGPAPTIAITADRPAIGRRTAVQVEVAEAKRGLSVVKVELLQEERVELLEERTYDPRPAWSFWGDRTERDAFEVIVGRDTQESLREGTATIRVTADRAGSLLRSPGPSTDQLQMNVKLRPPQLSVSSIRTYVAQGGAEAVVYTVSEDAVRDGVQSGDWFFPGYPLPGGQANERFALFGVPFDLDDVASIRLIAVDEVENQASIAFVDRFHRKPFREDEIRVSDGFMERVVPSILEQTPSLTDKGDLLQNYIMINNELRAANAATLNELATTSVPEFLWQETFLQMKNARVMSDFADRRTYTYNGEAIDHQDHLGFDLASTRRAELQAANTGVVSLARYFGIYGNAVVIDHGYGLFSLYGHLSEISVTEGQTVERGEIIGRTGQTGLAGGDHLHFTMLLQGLAVNPREWWDSKWIHDRLKLKLEDALPYE